VDSIALMLLLYEAREEYGLTLSAAHIDHGIRAESAEDAAYCSALCKQLGIPFYTVRLDVPSSAQSHRSGLEAEARRLRYEWLRRFKADSASDYIALAHHMDDQAETVLMHLSRGAGLTGMRGMREISADLYRPLLHVRKAALADYVRTKGILWREDFTNHIDDNPRNAIRLHVIPELEKSYPQVVRAIARYAQTAQIEHDYIENATRDYLNQSACIGSLCRWIELHPRPERALLRRALRGVCPVELSFEQVDALEALCGQVRGKLDIDKDWHAYRTGGRLYYVPKRRPSIPPVALSLDGVTALAPLCGMVAEPCAPVPIRNDPMRQALKRRALEGAVLRTRRDGDRIRPLGCGDKLLSDYFIDKKVDQPLRDITPLIAVGHRVLWVCGYGIAQEAALNTGDEAVRLTCTIDYTNGGKPNAK
jgi:tRNA(Ile)-lysidine synthase